MKTKLVVIVIMILFLSSGFLFYIDVPWIFYGFLALSVFFVLVIVFLAMSLTEQQGELFRSETAAVAGTTETEPEKSIQNDGLGNIFKAEKKYKRSTNHSRGSSGMRTRHLKTTENKPRSLSQRKADLAAMKNPRIGSVPIEESISKERISLRSKYSKLHSADKSEKVTTFLCPECGSKELYYEAGLISGYKYHCKDCDYIGGFVIEKDFMIND
jgi:predicted RNA-binding Zn-ribbon protein involved in translation (DUF1610 family)